MAANRSDVDRWIKEARDRRMGYILSICDTWDYDDYPIYCKDKKELKGAIRTKSSQFMVIINEVIRVTEKDATEGIPYTNFL